MVGIRIGRYKPSGLQDWEKILVGIAGLKNPIGNLLHFCQCETQTCGYFHCFGSEKSTMSLNGSSSKDGHYRGSQWQIVSIDARKFPVICANVQKVIFSVSTLSTTYNLRLYDKVGRYSQNKTCFEKFKKGHNIESSRVLKRFLTAWRLI